MSHQPHLIAGRKWRVALSSKLFCKTSCKWSEWTPNSDTGWIDQHEVLPSLSEKGEPILAIRRLDYADSIATIAAAEANFPVLVGIISRSA